MKNYPSPLTDIRVGYFLRARVQVHQPKKGVREFDVTVFHQKNNPQTSVGSVFSGLK
jgi:hypothetical protein